MKTQHLSLAPQRHSGPIVVSVDTPLPNVPAQPVVHQDPMVPVPAPQQPARPKLDFSANSSNQVLVNNPIVKLPETSLDSAAQRAVVENPPTPVQQQSSTVSSQRVELPAPPSVTPTQPVVTAKMPVATAAQPVVAPKQPVVSNVVPARTVPASVESAKVELTNVRPAVTEQLGVAPVQVSPVAVPEAAAQPVAPVSQDFIPQATKEVAPVAQIARNPLKDLPLPEDRSAVQFRNDTTSATPIQRVDSQPQDRAFEIRVPNPTSFPISATDEDAFDWQSRSPLQQVSSSSAPRNFLRASASKNQMSVPQRMAPTGREPFDYSSVDVTPATSIGFLSESAKFNSGSFGSQVGRPFFGTAKTTCCDEWAGFCPCQEVNGVQGCCGTRSFAERRHFFDGFFDGFGRNARGFGKPDCGCEEAGATNECGCDEPTCRTCVNFKLLDVNVHKK